MGTDIFARSKTLTHLVAVVMLLLQGRVAYAAVQPAVTARIQVVAQSNTDTIPHWIAPVGVTLSGSCNGAIYIPNADKEMFAVALTAQANKLEVELYYDNAATTKTIPYGYSTPTFNTSCKVIAINLKYVA